MHEVPLDVDATRYLTRMGRLGLQPQHEAPVPISRDVIERLTPELAGPPEPTSRREDWLVPGAAGGIRVRLWAPSHAADLPVLVYLHGGGWVIGGPSTHEALCAAIANRAGVMVAAPDYRLAPEHPYPAPLDDSEAVVRWFQTNGAEVGANPRNVAVGGDSAGGNMAAAIGLRSQGWQSTEIRALLLLYPMLDPRCDSPSFVEYGRGFGLTAETTRWYWSSYLADSGAEAAPEVAVLRAPDLSGMPPTYVLTCEFDPLRDEGEAFAARLAASGIAISLDRVDGTIHGFVRLPASFANARPAIKRIATWLGAYLHRPTPGTLRTG